MTVNQVLFECWLEADFTSTSYTALIANEHRLKKQACVAQWSTCH